MQEILINLNEIEYKASIDRNNSSILELNGKKFHIEILKRHSKNVYSFLINNRIFQVELNIKSQNPSQVFIDGFNFDINITDETQKLIKKFVVRSDGVESGALLKIKAPMPGMVIKILVNEGAEVNKGDKLIIIEAMKMENALISTLDGVVKKINAKENTPVEKDSILIEIEPHKT